MYNYNYIYPTKGDFMCTLIYPLQTPFDTDKETHVNALTEEIKSTLDELEKIQKAHKNGNELTGWTPDMIKWIETIDFTHFHLQLQTDDNNKTYMILKAV